MPSDPRSMLCRLLQLCVRIRGLRRNVSRESARVHQVADRPAYAARCHPQESRGTSSSRSPSCTQDHHTTSGDSSYARQTTLFGVTYPTPLLVAPIGCQAVLHPEAECATARAAGALGIPLVLSGAASRSLEAVAAANGEGAPRWFQLYWCVPTLPPLAPRG